MRKKKALLAGLLLIVSATVSGCGNAIPEMTESQEKAISEYAVNVLLKYDTSNESRLVDLSLYEEPVKEEEIIEPEESVGMDPVEEIPEIQIGDPLPEVSLYNVEEVLGMDGVCNLTYKDYVVTDSYDSGVDGPGYVSVEASAGMKLLITRFTLENISGKEQSINMIAKDVEYQIAVSGERGKSCQVTLLENDLSTYFGTFPADGSTEVVLVTEISDEVAKDIRSLSLSVESEDKKTTISLF